MFRLDSEYVLLLLIRTPSSYQLNLTTTISSKKHLGWKVRGDRIIMSAKSGRSNKNPVKTQTPIPLTREALAKMKLKALRRGIWFKDLKREERKLLELTIRVVEKVRSFLLAKLVSRIIDKLSEAMESMIIRLMRTEGRSLAKKISKIAQAWGNRSAKSWAGNRGFIQFLTISNLSSLKT